MGRLVASDQVISKLSSTQVSIALVSDSPSSGSAESPGGLANVSSGSQELAFLTNCRNADTTGPGSYLEITVLEDDFKITFSKFPKFIKPQYDTVN